MSAADVTVIGRGARIRGRVQGAASVEIQGLVDGEVTVEGDVTIDSEGLVAANVSGRRLVVRGAVKGDLSGVDAIVLEEGARVVGDVRAPRVAIAPGALVRGYVQTGGVDGAPKKSTTAARPAARPAVVAKPAPAPAPAKPVVVAKPAPAPAPAPKVVAPAPKAMPVALAGGTPAPKGPPPPVVPALKKGAKGALHKKKAN
jgi:cytoskeletal protein CcmA (bactofilin family)